MTKNEQYRQIEQLPVEQSHILCFLAYIGEEASLRVVDRFAMREGLTRKEQTTLLDRLAKGGFCHETPTLRDTLWQVNQPYMLQALKFMYIEHPQWEKDLDSYCFFRMTRYATLQRAIKNAIQKKEITGIGSITTYEDTDYMDILGEIAFDPDLTPVVNIVGTTTFITLISNIISTFFWENRDFPADTLTKMVDGYTLLDNTLKSGMYSIIALYHYYYDGTYKPLPKGKDIYDLLLQGIHAIHEGRYEEALGYYLATMKTGHQYWNGKGLFNQPLHNYFLVALYIKVNNEKTRTEIERLAKQKSLEKDIAALPALVIAKRFLGESSLKIIKTLNSPKYDVPLIEIMGKCLAKLTNNYDESAGSIPYPKYAIMRHEFQSMLNLSDKEKDDLNALYGSPAYTPGRMRQKWELMLETIEQLSLKGNEASATPDKDQEKERLIYIVGHNSVMLRMQKILKNGKWSTPRDVVKYRYEEFDYDCMDDIDKKLWKILIHNYYYGDIDQCMPLLIGCDRVFYGKDLSPVTINEEKAYLLLEKRGDGYEFSSNLTKVTEDKTQYIVKHSDTHYSVITITPQQAAIYANLLRFGKLPSSAEEQLRKTMTAVAQCTEVHSPLLGNEQSLPTIASSNKVIVQVKPTNQASFSISLLVKPLADGNDYKQPGQGEKTIICSHAGERYKVERNLNKEKKAAERLAKYLDTECSDEDSYMEYDNYNGVYDGKLSPEDMLKALDFIIQNSDSYDIEWPAGGRIKLLPQPQNWDVGMHRSGGWFEIEGNVTIDEGQVIKIAELLNMAKAFGNSNFVKLGDNEYIMLSEAIRKQLARLEAIAQRDGTKIVVPINNASLLSEAMMGDIDFANQEELQDMCRKIKASYELKPQPPKQLQAMLRSYQLDGFQWMVQLDSWDAGACLADDMGLGKTVQTIALMLYKAHEGASLVVAPTSVVSNWENEIHKFAPTLNVTLLNTSNNRKETIDNAKANDVILTTYGILANDTENISKKDWNIVCLDEAHTIKNRETKMAHAVHSLNAKTRIALTGTPLQNHLGELWSLFNFINPGLLGTYDFFRQKFVTPIEAHDKSRQEQLRRIVLPFMLRRTKQEVAKELPDKTESIRYVELSDEEMNVYELIRRDAKRKLEEEGKVSVSVLAEITKLRQAACAAALANPNLNFKSSKIEQLTQLVDNIGEEGNRILIFSQFTSFLKMVKDAFDQANTPYLYLDGATSLKQREKLVSSFQKGKCRIFIISLKAGGLGLNLTEANYVIHMDPWWNPAIEQQATDRAYRIGQQQKVTVFHLISAHTIEEKILRLHQTKRDLADSLLEGANVSHKITEEELNQLLT